MEGSPCDRMGIDPITRAASCVDQAPGFPAERLTWAIIQLLGAARDTNRDTK